MVSFIELNQQNHKITELSNVLSYLIGDRSICDTAITCDLFFTYVAKVREHLDLEERELYQALLAHRESRVRNTAGQFLSGSSEIKRVFGQYLKRWCKNKELRIKDHDTFVKDTREMFQLVLERIENEVENLYPMVRAARGEERLAA